MEGGGKEGRRDWGTCGSSRWACRGGEVAVRSAGGHLFLHLHLYPNLLLLLHLHLHLDLHLHPIYSYQQDESAWSGAVVRKGSIVI